MQNEISFSSNANATLIQGSAGSGKTAHIVNSVLNAIQNGGSNILVLCASPLAAQAFTRRLQAAAGSAAVREAVTATTARELALQVLATPSVVAQNGREARMLAGVSFQFLMQDMKTTSLKPKRLQEMLLFFYKSFTELADDANDWLVTEEERMVHGALQDFLDLRRAYIEPQLSAAALHVLACDEQLKAKFDADLVFVDDYQCLSRASQLLAGSLARKEITITWDASACTEVFDSYPYAKGAEELTENFSALERVTLERCNKPTGIGAALEQLAAQTNGAAWSKEPRKQPASGVEITVADTPLEEFKQLAAAVSRQRSAGGAQDMAVAVPNSTWANNCCKALNAAGVETDAPFTRTACVTSANSVTSANARTLALLRLVANPHDALGWRDWCGFGDHLANSGAFSAISAYAKSNSLALFDALEALCCDNSAAAAVAQETTSVHNVLNTFQMTKAIVEQLQSSNAKTQEQLLQAAISFATNGHMQQIDPRFAQLCLASSADDAANATPAQLAATICAHADSLLAAPRMIDQNAVLVAPFDAFAGYSVSTLFVTGLVNGFFPDYDYFDTTVTMLDKQQGIHEADARMFYALVAAAQQQLTASRFKKIDLETAEKLRVKVARIYLDNGKRTGEAIPSDFLAAF